jgi:hypothetical protein
MRRVSVLLLCHFKTKIKKIQCVFAECPGNVSRVKECH